jgi:cysteinyl-tRNA synthetase, unknown class
MVLSQRLHASQFAATVKLAAAATFTIAAAIFTPGPSAQASSLLNNAQSWAYQLQGDASSIARSGADVAVVDADHMRGSVSKLKSKPGGGRRIVIAYLAIGEVESYRSYYKSCCANGKPDWVTGKTQGWAGNYIVHFWRPEWKAIVRERVKQIMAAGFDGIYIDRVDTYENIKAPGSSRGAMIQLVREVSGWARSSNGNAAIMVQNGEELLDDRSYLSAIDAVAKEDLFHGIKHKGERNPTASVNWSAGKLKLAQNAGKKIFVIEYLKGDAANTVRAEARKYGFVPFFGPRDLKSVYN